MMARVGDVVLLSPACTSYDAYANFEQRGEHFCQLVEALGQDRGQPGKEEDPARIEAFPNAPVPSSPVSLITCSSLPLQCW
jgi:hypothetical protein